MQKKKYFVMSQLQDKDAEGVAALDKELRSVIQVTAEYLMRQTASSLVDDARWLELVFLQTT